MLGPGPDLETTLDASIKLSVSVYATSQENHASSALLDQSRRAKRAENNARLLFENRSSSLCCLLLKLCQLRFC
jgi:hypothetical protein